MRYATRRNKGTSSSTTPIENVIPLEQPVKIYSAKELAAMPLSVMNAAIEAQERFYLLEETTHMGGAGNISPSAYARRIQTYSGQREIPHTIQDQQRIYPTKDHSSVGKAWVSEVRWAIA